MSKVSLAEILGRKGAASAGGGKLSLSDLPDLIGEGMPEIPFDAVGRHRLVTALRNRFGEGFRNIKAVKDILADFEEQHGLEERISRLKEIKYIPKKKKE